MNQFGGSELVKAVVLLLISAVFMATAQTVYSTADCWYNGDGSLRACYVCTNTAAMTLWSVAALWIATGLTFDEFTDWSYFEQKWELTTGCTAVIDG